MATANPTTVQQETDRRVALANAKELIRVKEQELAEIKAKVKTLSKKQRPGKERKPIVSQSVVFYNRKTKTGQLRTGKRRHEVIYYEFDRVNKTLKYGAVVFRPKDATVPFDADGHRKTAVDRFTKNPVVLTGISDDETLKEFNQKLRKMIFKHGCHGKKQKNEKAVDTQVSQPAQNIVQSTQPAPVAPAATEGNEKLKNLVGDLQALAQSVVAGDKPDRPNPGQLLQSLFASLQNQK